LDSFEENVNILRLALLGALVENTHKMWSVNVDISYWDFVFRCVSSDGIKIDSPSKDAQIFVSKNFEFLSYIRDTSNAIVAFYNRKKELENKNE